MNYEFGLFVVELATLERNFAEFYEAVKGGGNTTVINAMWKIKGAIVYLRSVNKSNFVRNHEQIMLSLESMRVSVEIIITEVGNPRNTNFFLKVINGMIIGMGGSEKSHIGDLSEELKDVVIAIDRQYSAAGIGNKVPESQMRIISLNNMEEKLRKRNLSIAELNELSEALKYFKRIARGLSGAIEGVGQIKENANIGLTTITKIIKLMPKG